jgi:hypothetical protein
VAVVRSVVQTGGAGQGELRRFRGEVYDCFTARADALFELVDGICSPIEVGGIAHVSLAPGARRGHGAGYAAVSAGRIDTDMVRDVLAAARPASWLPDFAVDTTVWMRCDAECSPQRGFYYHPSRHSAGQPIVAGWCYSWLVGLSAGADSWTAPLDAHRLLVGDNPNLVAAGADPAAAAPARGAAGRGVGRLRRRLRPGATVGGVGRQRRADRGAGAQ